MTTGPATADHQALSPGALESRMLRLVVAPSVRFLWFVALPVLAGSWIVRYLVPTPEEARGTWSEALVATATAHELGVWLAACGLCALLSRYWSFLLPPLPSPAKAVESGRRVAVGLVVVALASAGAAILLLRGFGTYRVLSASMLPTLEPLDVLAGARVTATKGAPPARGEVAIFKTPAGVDGPAHLIKRVIGLPGDRISMNHAHPIINGWEVPSCDAGVYAYAFPEEGGVVGRLAVEFLDDSAHLVVYAPTDFRHDVYDVKPGEVFVLGDNRNNSSDSRAWDHGKGAGLPVDAIEALATRRLFGLHRNGRVDLMHPLTPLELSVRMDGVDSAVLREGIARCLKNRPTQTRPPKPNAS